jgi:hypothetical protein
MSDLSLLKPVRDYERELDDLAEINAKQAERDILEGDTLRPIISAYELDFANELARIMRSLDRACRGDEISRDAVLTACSNIEQKLLAASYEYQEIK